MKLPIVGGIVGVVEGALPLPLLPTPPVPVGEEVGTVPSPYMYIFRRLGPPQYSVGLLLQVMLQSEALVFTAPAERALPQKH